MLGSRGIGRRFSDERGAVLTTFAIAIPTLILFAALALDVGNWYVHKRQLQNRSDAAALAAAVAYGTLYPRCAENTTQGNALEDQITTVAKQFGGATGVSGAVNTAVNDPVRTTVVVNSPSYTGAGAVDGADGGGPCTPHVSGDEVSAPGTAWTDVKATESNVASLFGGFGVPVPAITSNARVALLQPSAMSGLRPLAAADPRLTECAWAVFREDDSSPTVLQRIALDPTSPGSTRREGDAFFGMPNQNVRVDVELGDCTDSDERITYTRVGSLNENGGGGNNPSFDGIFLTSTGGGAGCSAALVPRTVTSCSYNVQVNLDFPGSGGNPSVTADFGGFPVQLTGGSSDGTWVAPFPILVGAGEGSGGNGTVPITVCFNRRNLSSGCVDGGDTLLTIMAGDDRQQGGIAAFGMSGPTSYDNAQNVDTTVTLDLAALPSAVPGEDPVVLRGAVSANGLSGPTTCAGSTFAQAIAGGCPTLRTKGSSSLSVAGAQGTSAYAAAWAPGGACTPNNWGDYPDLPRGDPRLITVPLSPVGAPYATSGDGASQPVAGYAAFYVTGWAGTTCAGDDTLADAGAPDITASVGGELIGHFVKYVAPPSAGTPGSLPCVTESATRGVNACLASLVR